MEREAPFDSAEQLNTMRERTQKEEDYRKSDKFKERQRDRKFEQFRAVLMGIVLAICVLAVGMLLVHNYTYSTYSVDQETDLSQGKTTKMFSFQNGSVIVSGDAVTYYVGEKQIFTVSLSLKQAGFSAEGDYFTLYSEGAYEGYLFSESGLLCTIKTESPVHGMDCAKTGVSVILTGSYESSQLSYYNKMGSALSVVVQAATAKTGYPVAFSLSPDGQKLAVAYYSIKEGLGESDLYVYDFENGSAENNYILATDTSFKETDTFLASCRFTDDSHLTVVGDQGLYFYNLKQMDAPVKVTLSGEVSSVKEIGDDTLLVYRENDETICERYSKKGKLKNTFRCIAEYEHITANQHYVLFWSGADITFYNASGVLRYAGTLVSSPTAISFTGSRSLLINDGETIQKITLK